MLVLLHALVIERGDELLDQFDKLVRLSDGRARRRVDDKRRKTARQRDELAAARRSARGSCWSAPRQASCRWTASAAKSAWSGCTWRPRSSRDLPPID
jgi:hypothetical protein